MVLAVAHHVGMNTSQTVESSTSEFLLSSRGLLVSHLLALHGALQVGRKILCAGLSGCHIPRWHVVTAPSGRACCPKKKKPQQIKPNRPPT